MITHCSRCQGPQEDWTPGCPTCRERHRRRALRSANPVKIRAYRAWAREHTEIRWQDFARAVRDGDPRFMTITRYHERRRAA